MKTIEQVRGYLKQIREILRKDIKISKARMNDADTELHKEYQNGIYDEATYLMDFMNGIGEDYKGESNEND